MPFALLTARCLREETSLNLPHAVSFLPLLCVRGSQLCNRIAAHGRRRAAPFNITRLRVLERCQQIHLQDRSRPALCCLEREQRTPALPVRCATDVHTSQSCPAFAFIFRIKPKVIDNAQGDEADLSSTTWSPHLHQSSAEDLRGTPAFVAADLRCTLGLIRSIAFLVVLANRGNFIGHEKNAITQGRAQDLAVYKSFAQRGVNKRFKSCKKCETHDHTTGDCTADGINMSDKVCERTSCGEEGHTAAFCPKRFCGNCAERNHHTSGECPLDDFLCSACGRKVHNYFNCTTSAGSQWCSACECPSCECPLDDFLRSAWGRKGHTSSIAPHPQGASGAQNARRLDTHNSDVLNQS
ncbi:hypothetical protein SNK04_003719 [Fusarium graminearum]